jgi:hypothetical protein
MKVTGELEKIFGYAIYRLLIMPCSPRVILKAALNSFREERIVHNGHKLYTKQSNGKSRPCVVTPAHDLLI